MRIALIWNAPYVFSKSTAPYAEYQRGFMQLGHEVRTYFQAGAEDGYPFPVELFDGEPALCDPRFWSIRPYDVAVLFTWHRMAGVLSAMRAAGIRSVALGDSDGCVSLRAHPRATLRQRMDMQPTWRLRAGAAKLWLLDRVLRGRGWDRGLIAATEAADAFVLGASETAAIYRRFLAAQGAREAMAKVEAVPYPVAETFCTGPVTQSRPNRAIAVARWDAAQKNAALLAAALDRAMAAGCQTEFLIVGRHAESRFGAVARRNPRVHLLGLQPRDRVRELMAESRVVLFASRWESGPIAANEMLALGGTVVGTPIPSLCSIAVGQRFGRVSRKPAGAALAEAIQSELRDWDAGRRDPQAIAAHWRPLVSPAGVCRRLLEVLEAAPVAPAAPIAMPARTA